MNRLSGVLFFFLGTLVVLNAQNTIKLGENFYKGDEVGVVFNEEISTDLVWHTNGYAFNMNFANIINYSLANYYFIGFGQLKHPKEYRQKFELFRWCNTRSIEAILLRFNVFQGKHLRGGYH